MTTDNCTNLLLPWLFEYFHRHCCCQNQNNDTCFSDIKITLTNGSVLVRSVQIESHVYKYIVYYIPLAVYSLSYVFCLIFYTRYLVITTWKDCSWPISMFLTLSFSNVTRFFLFSYGFRNFRKRFKICLIFI